MTDNADALILDAVVAHGTMDDKTHAAALGGNVLTLPAVLVPPGGTPPVGDWVLLGTARRPRRPGTEDQDEQGAT